jgi:hypothetical protein
MFHDVENNVNFGRFYSQILLTFHISLATLVLIFSLSGITAEVTNSSEILAQIGLNLIWTPFLLLQFSALFLAVFLSKRWSNHRASLYLPPIDELNLNWKSVNKAPFPRRTALKVKHYMRKLIPLKTVVKYLALLALTWIGLAYIIVCFGAPVLSDHWETASFVTLLSIQTLWPIILIHSGQLKSSQI